MPKLLDIHLDDITVADRHRQDLGDLEELADSIEKVGLLQPIGVTKDKRLVFGERRLEAVKFLNWKTIPARIIEIERIVDGEYAENEMRKDFTPEERVAITKSLKGYGHGGDRRSDQAANVQLDTAEAAKKAGFGSERTYHAARKVVENAAREVVDAMNTGDLSISAAAVIADQPEAEQKRIAALPKAEQKKAVAELRKPLKPPSPDEAKRLAMETGQPVVDSNGIAQSPMAPEKEKRIMGAVSVLHELERFIEEYGKWADNLDELIAGIRQSKTRTARAEKTLTRAFDCLNTLLERINE